MLNNKRTAHLLHAARFFRPLHTLKIHLKNLNLPVKRKKSVNAMTEIFYCIRRKFSLQ